MLRVGVPSAAGLRQQTDGGGGEACRAQRRGWLRPAPRAAGEAGSGERGTEDRGLSVLRERI